MVNALLPLGALLVGIFIGRRFGRNEGIGVMLAVLASQEDEVPEWVKDQRAAARDQ